MTKKHTKQQYLRLNLTTDQKLSLVAIFVVLVFLISLVAFRQTSFRYKSKEISKEAQLRELTEQEQYAKLLAAIKPDREASRRLFKEVITEEEVKKIVETDLDVDQKIPQVGLKDSELAVAGFGGSVKVVDYFKTIAPGVREFAEKVRPITMQVFRGEAGEAELGMAKAKVNWLIQNFKASQVPTEAVAFHKAEILALESFKAVLTEANNYARGVNSKPWPEIYKNYVIADKQLSLATEEFQKLDAKYSIKTLALESRMSKYAAFTQLFSFKTAHAQFGGPVTVVGNIPQQIKDGIEEAFASAYARYSTQLFDTLLSFVENEYRIVSQFLYGQAVQEVYIDEVLSKYSNAVDSQIIKRFIPMLTCGQEQNKTLRPFMEAKAKQYLGFDPENVSKDDPEFEKKMARVGEFLANPYGWETYYEEAARLAESEAEKAANKEIMSSGLKSPRDLVNKQISASLNVIEGSQLAALVSSMQLGSVNAQNIVSQLVTSALDTLANKFIFKGAVLQEENVCLPLPVIDPVMPVDDQIIRTPDFNPNANTGNTNQLR